MRTWSRRRSTAPCTSSHGLAAHRRGHDRRAATVYSELKNLCVWSKTNGGMGSLYRSQHELFFVFKCGHRAAHQQRRARQARPLPHERLDATPAPTASAPRATTTSPMHPTVKPVALVADAILDCSHRRGIILDAFAGSGTTLVAAHKAGRRGYGIELDPHYCDVIIRAPGQGGQARGRAGGNRPDLRRRRGRARKRDRGGNR